MDGYKDGNRGTMKYFFLILIFLNFSALVSAADTKSIPTPRVPPKDVLKKLLTPEQYRCTQEAGTEKPFDNAYWNKKDDGIYVDVVSGEPLFSSLNKYDSGSGWPSFDRPIEESTMVRREDKNMGVPRTEIRSKQGDSHLGHVFNDGPKETTGLRYCVNSASMKFVPLDKMKEQGYGAYLFSFAGKKGWKIATVAGGCFWGVEELLRKIPGVIETQTGYTGGNTDNATYDIVKKGSSQHAESVQILFDPKNVSYESLLLTFFKLHDPTTVNKQGNDVGTQYRSAIFFMDKEQKSIAEKVKARVEKSKQWKKPVVTEITAFNKFWRAEDEHQKYLEKKPDGYTCHFVRDLKF